MPAHRKPTHVLEASGAFDRNPGRRRGREGEPKPTETIGEPPAYFDQTHRETWRELVRTAPDGVLFRSDRLHLEITSRLLVKMRRSQASAPKWLTKLAEVLRTLGWDGRAIQEMTDVFKPCIAISGQEMQQLQQCLAKMGLNPADRTRITVTPVAPGDDPLTAAMNRLLRPEPVQ